MFESDRIFSCSNPGTGLMEWFFSARNAICGPYSSKEQATKGLKEFIQHCLDAVMMAVALNQARIDCP